jgi:hypothetical protein
MGKNYPAKIRFFDKITKNVKMLSFAKGRCFTQRSKGEEQRAQRLLAAAATTRRGDEFYGKNKGKAHKSLP